MCLSSLYRRFMRALPGVGLPDQTVNQKICRIAQIHSIAFVRCYSRRYAGRSVHQRVAGKKQGRRNKFTRKSSNNVSSGWSADMRRCNVSRKVLNNSCSNEKSYSCKIHALQPRLSNPLLQLVLASDLTSPAGTARKCAKTAPSAWQ